MYRLLVQFTNKSGIKKGDKKDNDSIVHTTNYGTKEIQQLSPGGPSH